MRFSQTAAGFFAAIIICPSLLIAQNTATLREHTAYSSGTFPAQLLRRALFDAVDGLENRDDIRVEVDVASNRLIILASPNADEERLSNVLDELQRLIIVAQRPDADGVTDKSRRQFRALSLNRAQPLVLAPCCGR